MRQSHAEPRGERLGRALLPCAQRLVTGLHLGTDGFTLLASLPPDELRQPAIFHLVAGASSR